MGAALVLESLRPESGFCAVVADSSFSNFRSVAYDREGYFVGAGRFGMERIVGRTVGLLPAEIGLLYARWRYGVDLRRANPVDAVKSSTVPVLLIHGEEDINILPWHSRALAQADPIYAQLWIVPGAGHCGAAGVAPDEFWSRVLDFFARHNRAQPDAVSHLFPME
jgi:pimeloyl-ACP methyl ester carboxylesterase